MAWSNTASLIEIVWTGPAVLGLLFTLWMVADIWRDREALRRSRWNGLARLQVERWLRGEIIIAACHAIFVGVGVFALLAPPAPARVTTYPPLIQAVITGLFILVPTLLVLRSIGDRVVRHAIRRQRFGP